MATDNLTVIVTLVDKASKKIGTLSGALGKFTKAVGLATVAVGALSAIVGVKAVQEFAKFEKSMSNVEAITGATAEEMKGLEDVAKEMGRTTAFTAKEAAEGMTFLGMAGFETNQIMEALPATLNLAAAANIDLGKAADISSNILTGFRLEAEESERVVDVLAKTVTSSNTNMEQLSEAMKLFAPSAAAFGVSVEEASAAVGILGNSGLQGSIATQALATSMVRLSKPTKSMSAKMKELNLDFFDANGQFIGLTETVALLEDRYKTLTPEQQANATATIFGARAVKQWNVLVAAGSEELKKYTGELENSGGAAQKMADVQLDNLTGAFTLFKSAVNGVMIELGSKLAPVVTDMIRKLTDLINKGMANGSIMNFLENMITRVKNAFIFLRAIMTPFIDAILPQIRQGIEFLKFALNDGRDETQNWMEGLKVLAAIIGTTLGFAIKTAMSFIGLFIRGLKSVFNLIEKIGSAFQKMKTALSRGGSKVKSFFGFADGGIVPKPQYFANGGRAKGTDTVPAMLTPGELILNKAQQKNLSGHIGGGSGVTINVQGNLVASRDEAMKFANLIAAQLGLSTAMV